MQLFPFLVSVSALGAANVVRGGSEPGSLRGKGPSGVPFSATGKPQPRRKASAEKTCVAKSRLLLCVAALAGVRVANALFLAFVLGVRVRGKAVFCPCWKSYEMLLLEP